jgi:branched-chain amino acid transport system ATP-binding protein
MQYLLETKKLGRRFDGFVALKDVDFGLEPGEIHAIIGPNGAGKTTFFRLLFGELFPTTGRVFFGDRDITGFSSWQICRLGIGRSYQITNIFPQLTVYENVRIAVQATKSIYNFWSAIGSFISFEKEAKSIISEIGLISRMSDLASNLSHGEQRTLELGLALSSKPHLLLLDEPTAGMSMEETRYAIKLIQKIAKDRDLTILVVEHKMDVIHAIADRITVLHQGSVLATGSYDEVRENELVRNVYFRGKVERA